MTLAKNQLMISKKLTSTEMSVVLDQFVDSYEIVVRKLTEDENANVQRFINQVSLLIPCYSLRPDKLVSLNDSIFNDTVITQFILDLSFRFFTCSGNSDDYVERLISNIVNGICIDGPDVTKNIIPKTISQSCAINVFSNDSDLSSLWKKFFGSKPDKELRLFLENNKHLVVVYLIYLTNM